MTTPQPAALPELPEPVANVSASNPISGIGFVKPDKPYYTAEQMRAYALAALQSQPAAAGVSDAGADDDFADKFDGWIETIKAAHDESLDDLHKSSRAMLRDLIDEMEAHRAILALRPQAESKRVDAIMAHVHDLYAELGIKWGDNPFLALSRLRPQAVPMTAVDVKALRDRVDQEGWPVNIVALGKIVKYIETHHGITAQGAQGAQGGEANHG